MKINRLVMAFWIISHGTRLFAADQNECLLGDKENYVHAQNDLLHLQSLSDALAIARGIRVTHYYYFRDSRLYDGEYIGEASCMTGALRQFNQIFGRTIGDLIYDENLKEELRKLEFKLIKNLNWYDIDPYTSHHRDAGSALFAEFHSWLTELSDDIQNIAGPCRARAADQAHVLRALLDRSLVMMKSETKHGGIDAIPQPPPPAEVVHQLPPESKIELRGIETDDPLYQKMRGFLMFDVTRIQDLHDKSSFARSRDGRGAVQYRLILHITQNEKKSRWRPFKNKYHMHGYFMFEVLSTNSTAPFMSEEMDIAFYANTGFRPYNNKAFVDALFDIIFWQTRRFKNSSAGLAGDSDPRLTVQQNQKDEYKKACGHDPSRRVA